MKTAMFILIASSALAWAAVPRAGAAQTPLVASVASVSTGASAGAGPQTAATPLSTEQLISSVRQAVEQASHAVMAQHPGVRVQTQVGSLSPQLKLAPCLAAEPFLQPGVRIWGEIRIGLRCTQGPVRWNVFVPATVRVYGPAWVATSALPPGHVMTEGDLVRQETEWTGEPGLPAVGAEALLGRALTQAIKPGQALRAQHVRARQWFTAGQPVTVLARGSGFAVAAEGVALTTGVEGQPAQVRLESGKVVQGMAVGNRRVEVSL